MLPFLFAARLNLEEEKEEEGRTKKMSRDSLSPSPPSPSHSGWPRKKKNAPGVAATYFFKNYCADLFFPLRLSFIFLVRESQCVVGKGASGKKFLIDDLRPSVNVVDGEEGSRCPSREKTTTTEVFQSEVRLRKKCVLSRKRQFSLLLGPVN